jgi:hypothetical protein
LNPDRGVTSKTYSGITHSIKKLARITKNRKPEKIQHFDQNKYITAAENIAA